MDTSLSFCSNYLDATFGCDISVMKEVDSDKFGDGDNLSPNDNLIPDAHEYAIPNTIEFDFKFEPSPFSSGLSSSNSGISLPKVRKLPVPKFKIETPKIEVPVVPKWSTSPYSFGSSSSSNSGVSLPKAEVPVQNPSRFPFGSVFSNTRTSLPKSEVAAPKPATFPSESACFKPRLKLDVPVPKVLSSPFPFVSAFSDSNILLPKLEVPKPKWNDNPAVASALKSKVKYEGYSFTNNNRVQNAKGDWVGNYRCSHRNECKITMQIKCVTKKSGNIEVFQTISTDEHTCDSSYDPIERETKKLKSGVLDLTDEMREKAKKLALEFPDYNGEKVADQVY